MADILARIVDTKRREVAEAKACVPHADLLRRCAEMPPARGFERAVRTAAGIAVIAEVKKASPSAGVIRTDFDPVSIARTYESHGASCLSVLTDEHYFQGSLAYLAAARAAVGIPVLRKEFIIDPYQLAEARAAGADAVLLIAECLPGELMKELHDAAKALGLDVLIELHDADQLPRVLDTGATLVGVNNRDLRTFTTRLEHTLDLLPHFPPSVAVVSESGIRTHAELQLLHAAGVRAVLVGESLMRSADIGAALDQLVGKASSPAG
ncbi:MAG: indole-3-glycerol phosphate synthase TrpC [Fimbriiglobus sp.]|jgi:indole-3-glycerol phosphate synthase|nr:indole-3-glycerol phosphate synthase TrpC [Fimbriiglobus sp.]